MCRRWFLFSIIVVISFLLSSAIYGGTSPSTEAGPTEDLIKKKEEVGELFKKPKPKLEEAEPEIEYKPIKEKPVELEKKFFVKDIVFSGNRVISSEKIEEIVCEYRGKHLSLQELQKITAGITNLYRAKGYITSRAYLPPQDISDGIVEIKILEGEVGRITVEGQRYFKGSLIKEKVAYELNKELAKEMRSEKKAQKEAEKKTRIEKEKEEKEWAKRSAKIQALKERKLELEKRTEKERKRGEKRKKEELEEEREKTEKEKKAGKEAEQKRQRGLKKERKATEKKLEKFRKEFKEEKKTKEKEERKAEKERKKRHKKLKKKLEEKRKEMEREKGRGHKQKKSLFNNPGENSPTIKVIAYLALNDPTKIYIAEKGEEQKRLTKEKKYLKKVRRSDEKIQKKRREEAAKRAKEAREKEAKQKRIEEKSLKNEQKIREGARKETERRTKKRIEARKIAEAKQAKEEKIISKKAKEEAKRKAKLEKKEARKAAVLQRAREKERVKEVARTKKVERKAKKKEEERRKREEREWPKRSAKIQALKERKLELEKKAKEEIKKREKKEQKKRAKEEARITVFNYNDLERGIRKLNYHPDRTVKAILSPGEEPRTTDILLKVKDRSPWHFYTEYNNRGTRYTGKNRYGVGLRNTNLLGRDDFLSLKFLMGEEKQLYAYSLDYNFPINMMGTRLGFYGSHATLDIGKEFAVLDVEGRATSYGVYLGQPLWDTRHFGGDLSLGFDIKSIKNFMLDEVTSHDELRVFKFGLSLDEKDNIGRTFLTNEFHFGIPEIFGGSRAVDDKASRLGAGGKFKKYVGSLSRVQKLPLYSLLIAGAKGQATWDDLVSAEQIAIGGADTVRGYPELESLGDYGYIINAELRTPPFLFPYFMKIKDKVQFVFFTDIGKTTLKSPAVGEDKSEYLRGAGPGIRIDIPDHFSARVDCGFPLAEEPSDGAPHIWHIGAQIKF